MKRVSLPWPAVCVAAAAFISVSCSLRLPVEKVAMASAPQEHRYLVPADDERDPDVRVWLVSDRYHTGLVVPWDWLVESGFVPPPGFGSPQYVAMSWGNRDAYSAAGFDHPWKIFRVLFTPTRSVMELIPFNWNVTEVLPQQQIWQALVPRRQGPTLAAFLNACSETDAQGRPVVVCESSWGNGVQLASRHRYFIPRVCNVWTVQALEAAGGEYRPWLALTAGGLIRQAEKPANGFELIWPGGGVPER